MQRVLYNKTFKIGVWLLLFFILLCVFYVIWCEWQTCKKVRNINQIDNDRIEQTYVVSLDKKGNSYSIFAQNIQAQHDPTRENQTKYHLDLPRAVLRTPNQQCEIFSRRGDLVVSKQLELFGDVILRNVHPSLHYLLKTQSALVDFKSQKIFGNTPINGECRYGMFSGKSFVLDKEGKSLIIQGPCSIYFSGHIGESL